MGASPLLEAISLEKVWMSAATAALIPFDTFADCGDKIRTFHIYDQDTIHFSDFCDDNDSCRGTNNFVSSKILLAAAAAKLLPYENFPPEMVGEILSFLKKRDFGKLYKLFVLSGFKFKRRRTSSSTDFLT